MDVSPEEVDHLVVEADAYSLASHLMWAFWALLQSKVRVLCSRFENHKAMVKVLICMFREPLQPALCRESVP